MRSSHPISAYQAVSPSFARARAAAVVVVEQVWGLRFSELTTGRAEYGVLVEKLRDLILGRRASARSEAGQRKIAAARWFLGQDPAAHPSFSYLNVCRTLKVDPNSLLQILRRSQQPKAKAARTVAFYKKHKR